MDDFCGDDRGFAGLRRDFLRSHEAVPARPGLDFKAAHFMAPFNGKQLLEVEDSTSTDAGKVGLWTKDASDAV